MPLKFKYRDLWYHGRLVPKRVYAQLEDLQKQIDELNGNSSNSSKSSNTTSSETKGDS